MRTLFLMLAVLLLASAAYAADVTISCTADGNVVTVSYTASVDVNIPRGLGLDIKLSNAETINTVTPLDPNYWVYPGSYGDTNDPVGDPCDSSDTLPGEDSNGITIEMGSLHWPPEVNSPNAPEISNDLLSFKVTGDCNVTISGNAARGKVVLYDATNEDDGRDVVYTGCVVGGCFPPAHPDYDEWVAVGKPNCWCYPRQCNGDADGALFGKNSYWVSTPDLTILKAAWEKALPDLAGEPNICADFDHELFGKNSYRVATPDLTILKEYWEETDGPDPNCGL